MKKFIFTLFAMVMTAMAMVVAYLLTEMATGDIAGSVFIAMLVFIALGTVFLCRLEEVR